ncbi:MAG: energy transducer TonB [Methylococcales bacterium]|nr:energy transducer TonB [Methylococcales bacterium]MDD5755497.1 energy transducer TonB [Methylococcales bacterium]
MNKKAYLRAFVPIVIGVVLILLIVVGVYFLQSTFEKPAKPKKQIQQITMIHQPPPIPPPPVQKPPEPELKQEKISEPEKEPEPKPEPEETPEPQSNQLGVDADGTAGGDGFGLVGKKGGQNLLGGGTSGSTILWYGGLVKRNLESELQNILEGVARESSYSVQINIWINASGRVERAELGSSSGNTAVDNVIVQALPKLHFTLEKAPPENMPQPLKIRVTSRL